MNTNCRMKYILTICTFCFLFSCINTKKAIDFTVEKDANRTILKGIITRATVENDTAFKWFKENMKYGVADAAAVAAFKAKQNEFNLVVFGGTWCEDTQNLWPRFFQLIDKSGYPENKIQLIAVDLKKETIRQLHKKYAIENVPTFIVLHNGKEVGRVVEYGKMGDITKELGLIVAAIQ